jgi:hypothetical protein
MRLPTSISIQRLLMIDRQNPVFLPFTLGPLSPWPLFLSHPLQTVFIEIRLGQSDIEFIIGKLQ